MKYCHLLLVSGEGLLLHTTINISPLLYYKSTCPFSIPENLELSFAVIYDLQFLFFLLIFIHMAISIMPLYGVNKHVNQNHLIRYIFTIGHKYHFFALINISFIDNNLIYSFLAVKISFEYKKQYIILRRQPKL